MPEKPCADLVEREKRARAKAYPQSKHAKIDWGGRALYLVLGTIILVVIVLAGR